MVNTPPPSVHDSESDVDDQIETKISKLDFSNPLYLHASDTLSTPLIGFKLLGTDNYKVWACAMELALETKNKIGFIDGSCVKSSDNQILARQWDRCNAVVLNWILGCVSQELYLGQIFSKNAAIVWQELKDTYDKIDGSVIFNLHHKINSLTQHGSSLSEYYHKLTSLWKQYDALVKLPACSCTAAKDVQNHNDLLRLMQFLMGLDDVYMSVISNLLTREPLPSVKTAYAIISREESHRGGMNDKTGTSSANAFVAKGNFNKSASFKTSNSGFDAKKAFDNNFESRKTFDNGSRTFRPPNPNLHCSNCNKIGHTIERCFQLGYKKSGTSGNRFTSNNSLSHDSVHSVSAISVASSSNAVPSLTHEQLHKLLSLVDSQPSQSGLQANMAGFTSKESVGDW